MARRLAVLFSSHPYTIMPPRPTFTTQEQAIIDQAESGYRVHRQQELERIRQLPAAKRGTPVARWDGFARHARELANLPAAQRKHADWDGPRLSDLVGNRVRLRESRERQRETPGAIASTSIQASVSARPQQTGQHQPQLGSAPYGRPPQHDAAMHGQQYGALTYGQSSQFGGPTPGDPAHFNASTCDHRLVAQPRSPTANLLQRGPATPTRQPAAPARSPPPLNSLRAGLSQYLGEPYQRGTNASSSTRDSIRAPPQQPGHQLQHSAATHNQPAAPSQIQQVADFYARTRHLQGPDHGEHQRDPTQRRG